MQRILSIIVSGLLFVMIWILPSQAAGRCYDLGYRRGKCFTMGLHGLRCNPEDDFSMPVECRNDPEQKRGCEQAIRDLYEDVSPTNPLLQIPKTAAERTEQLLIAASMGDLEGIKRLLKAGADVNANRDDDWTALRTASYNGQIEAVKLLLDKGANVNAKTKDVDTALRTAIDSPSCKIEIVKALLDKGANVNARGTDGETALMRAVAIDDAETVKTIKLLLAKGTDINARDDNGETALYKATKDRYHKIVKILKAHGAK